MKLRNQASMAAQAAVASTTHKTTLINPQQVNKYFFIFKLKLNRF